MEYIKNMMPLNLQLFAEEGEEGEEDKGDEGNPDNAQSGEPEDGKAKVTTLTEDDVDRIVQKRLARARKKWDKDHTEAERLQKMTDDEKKQYEEDKRKEELDNREAAITRRELTAVAKEQLNAAGVPADMADFIDYTDADSVNESVKRLSKAFKGAVQQSVDDRLKGKAPLDKAKKCETKINQNVQKKTNLKTSLNNLEKIE